MELLNEMRVVLTGVQVLFAFLLTVPFAARFDAISELQRDVLVGCLIATALAAAALVAPTSFHRIRFRQRDKEALLRFGNRMALTGITLLGIAMTGVILLVCDVLFDLWVAVALTSLVGLTFAYLWFGRPLWRHAMDDRADRPD